jgi:hypothetical protein
MPPTLALMTVYDKQYEKNILTPLKVPTPATR